jgi:hypothetical protein
MRGHAVKRQCSGRLRYDRRAPPGRPIGVTPDIRAEARGLDKIPDGVSGVFRVGKRWDAPQQPTRWPTGWHPTHVGGREGEVRALRLKLPFRVGSDILLL